MDEIRTLPNTIHKNKLNIDKDLNLRLDTIKLLEENTGRTLFDINHSNTLFEETVFSPLYILASFVID